MRALGPWLIWLWLGLLLPPGGDGLAARREQESAVPSLAGQLLVAEPSLDDPNFRETVVLMVSHDTSGALGLVVNKPLGKLPLAKLVEGLLPKETGTVQGEALVMGGGPVQRTAFFVVHSAEYGIARTQRVTTDLAVTSDPAILKDMADGRGPKRDLVILGYAGWGPGQLERELAQGAWFTVPADPELVFGGEPEARWQRASERRGKDI